MHVIKVPRSFLVYLAFLALAACGGGGGGDSAAPAAPTYTIGGTVSGLAGSGLVLQKNGSNLTVTANGAFTFSGSVVSGTAYSVTVATQPSLPTQTCTVANGAGTATANVTNIAVTCVTNTFTVGGNVTGLLGTGLVLQNNSGGDVAVSSDGSFNFPAQASGSAYNVTVLTQPSGPSQMCTVNNGTGTVGAAAVTAVTVTCSTDSYTVGGTISGLSGSGLVLHNSTGTNVNITAGATSFAFPAQASGSAYAITVQTQPTGPNQLCTVNNGSGTIGGVNVTNVTVNCSNSYLIAGTVSGLSGSGLVLQNNGGADLAISSNGAFNFPVQQLSGSAYNVTVLTQPSGPVQVCSVTNGAANVGSSDTNVTIACTTKYTVGGTVSDLVGSGLVLQNNGGGDLPISADGSFNFPLQLDGSAYAVTVHTQPGTPVQTCRVVNGSGNVSGANVTNVQIACARFAYVANRTSNDISGFKVHPTTGVLTALTGSPFAGGTNPQSAKIDPTGKFLYVANGGGDVSAFAINLVTGALTGVTNSPFAAGANAHNVNIDPSGKYVYIANKDADSITAYTMSTTTGALTAVPNSPFTTTCVGPRQVTIDPTGKFAYAVCDGNPFSMTPGGDGIDLYTIDANTGELTYVETDVASTPWGMAIEATGKYAYVGRGDGSTTLKVFSINSTTGALTDLGNSSATTGNFPGWLAINPAGTFAYVVNNVDNTVTVGSINSSTGALTAAGVGPYSTAPGVNSEWITIDPTGGFAYVVNFDTDDISAFTLDSGTGAMTAVAGSPFVVDAAAVGTPPVKGPVSVAITPIAP